MNEIPGVSIEYLVSIFFSFLLVSNQVFLLVFSPVLNFCFLCISLIFSPLSYWFFPGVLLVPSPLFHWHFPSDVSYTFPSILCCFIQYSIDFFRLLFGFCRYFIGIFPGILLMSSAVFYGSIPGILLVFSPIFYWSSTHTHPMCKIQ